MSQYVSWMLIDESVPAVSVDWQNVFHVHTSVQTWFKSSLEARLRCHHTIPENCRVYLCRSGIIPVFCLFLVYICLSLNQ